MATSSSIFYCIIPAGIRILCLLGLTSLRVQNLDTTTPSLDGRNCAIVIAESLARVIAAIRSLLEFSD